MWWRLGLLGVVTAGILFFLLTPTTTMTIKVDLPPDVNASAGQVQIAATSAIWITETILVGGVLAIAGFIAWLIVRRYRSRV
jgi:hypothetical protein